MSRMWLPGLTAASRGRRAIQRRGNSHRSGEGIMIEKPVNIKTPDGVAEAEWFCPDEAGQWPGIIMYTDIGGLRPVFRDMARRLASEGFVVLVPNPFYRVSRVPVYPDPFQFGEEKTTARMGEVRKFVTPAGTERDAHAFVGFLGGLKQVAGKIGTACYRTGAGIATPTPAAEPHNAPAT